MISKELIKAMEDAAKAVDRWLDENVKLSGEGEVKVEMKPGQLGQERWAR